MKFEDSKYKIVREQNYELKKFKFVLYKKSGAEPVAWVEKDFNKNEYIMWSHIDFLGTSKIGSYKSKTEAINKLWDLRNEK